MAFSVFEGLVAVKRGTNKGNPVVKLVEAGKNDTAYAVSDVEGIIGAVRRGMEATGLPLMRYSAYLPVITRKDAKAHWSAADLKKALAVEGAAITIRRGNFGDPVVAVMLPVTREGRTRNESF